MLDVRKVSANIKGFKDGVIFLLLSEFTSLRALYLLVSLCYTPIVFCNYACLFCRLPLEIAGRGLVFHVEYNSLVSTIKLLFMLRTHNVIFGTDTPPANV